MITKFDKFDEILDTLENGNISSSKELIKRLNRSERYDLILYSRGNTQSLYETSIVSDTIMRWCVKGDFK